MEVEIQSTSMGVEILEKTLKIVSWKGDFAKGQRTRRRSISILKDKNKTVA